MLLSVATKAGCLEEKERKATSNVSHLNLGKGGFSQVDGHGREVFWGEMVGTPYIWGPQSHQPVATHQ